MMETIESIEKMCDGAKDKGNTTTIDDDDCPKAQNMQQQDKQITKQMADSDDDDDDYYDVLHLQSSDGVIFDAEPFMSHCFKIKFYICDKDMRTLQVGYHSKTLSQIQDFCVKFGSEEASSNPIWENKEFFRTFVKKNWLSSIELVTAALELKIPILFYSMLKGVDWLLRVTGYEDDDVYKLFPVNLKEYDDNKFESMKLYLSFFQSYFNPAHGWNPELIKMKYSEYKVHTSWKLRKQWLIAHFLLREDSSSYQRPKLKAVANQNISDMKRKGSPDEQQQKPSKRGKLKAKHSVKKKGKPTPTPSSSTESSITEIGRDANMCDGAKDKGNIAIDDDGKIPRTAGKQDKQMADKVYPVSYIESSDGTLYDAELLRKVSEVVHFYKCFRNMRTLQVVRIDGITLGKVLDFCLHYFEMARKNASCFESLDDENDEFYCKFLEEHRSSSIELVTAALDLEISPLFDLMLEGVDWLFKDTDENEVYELFPVNLKEYDEDKFERMKQYLSKFPLHLPPKPKCMSSRANKGWDPKLLKMTFSEYKVLPSWEEREQWLIAHFLLRDFYTCERPKFMAKDSSGTPMANPNISGEEES